MTREAEGMGWTRYVCELLTSLHFSHLEVYILGR